MSTIQTIPLIQVQDTSQNRFNQTVKQNFDLLQKIPFLDGNFLTAVSLSSGTNVINHGLQRAYISYLLGKTSSPATVYDSTPASMDKSLQLQLTVSADVTIDIWVFQMALQELTFSINLGQGIDQKDNDYVGDPQSFLDLKNMVYNKMKEADKRPGSQKLTTSVQSSFPNALAIGASAIPSGLVSHKDELLLQNKGVLYTYLENEAKWKFVGHQYPLQVKSETAASLQQSIYWPNMGKVGNVSVYAYVEINESLNSSAAPQGATVNLRYSVMGSFTFSLVNSK